MMIYVALSEDEKLVVSVFSCPQENTEQISADDPRYAKFYNSQSELIKRLLIAPNSGV